MALGLGIGLHKLRKAAGSAQLLLDTYSGAAAAYSLRNLTSSWDGQPVVRVRRSIDDAEANFTATELTDGTLVDWTYGKSTDTLPADHGSGAAAAYSLRYVSSAYSGDVVRVRRSSDNVEQDFTPTEITDGTLEAFCGVGDGYVTTWYDQKNSNDATQATAGNQPKIVSGGVVVTDNGKPAIGPFGSLSTSSFDIVSPSFLYICSRFPSSGNYLLDGKGGANRIAIYSSSGSLSSFWTDNSGASSPIVRTPLTNDFCSISVEKNGAQSKLFQNSIQLGADAVVTTDKAVGLTIGSRFNGVNNHTEYLSEIVIYDSDQSSNRLDIGANINQYYSIYDVNGFVTTWYDQSGNTNDATQATAGNQPKIVDAGSLVTEGGKPAILFIPASTTRLFSAAFGAVSQPVTKAVVTKPNATINPFGYIFGSTTLRNDIGRGSSFGRIGGFAGNVVSGGTSTTDHDVSFVVLNGASTTGHSNGVLQLSGDIGTSSMNSVVIGGHPMVGTTNADFGGTMQELIAWGFNQSSNRTEIEANMASYHGITI